MCINQFHSPTVLRGRYCKVCKSGKWSPERLSHLSKVTLLGSSVDQVVNPRPCIPNPFLIPPFMPKPHFTDGCWGWKGARERSCHWQWQPVLWNSRGCMLSLHPQALALQSGPAPDPSLSLPHPPRPCPFPGGWGCRLHRHGPPLRNAFLTQHWMSSPSPGGIWVREGKLWIKASCRTES